MHFGNQHQRQNQDIGLLGSRHDRLGNAWGYDRSSGISVDTQWLVGDRLPTPRDRFSIPPTRPPASIEAAQSDARRSTPTLDSPASGRSQPAATQAAKAADEQRS